MPTFITWTCIFEKKNNACFLSSLQALISVLCKKNPIGGGSGA